MLFLLVLLMIAGWIGRLTARRGGDSREEADAEVVLILLLLDHLRNWQPKHGYYLQTEIEHVAGSSFKVWIGSGAKLEKRLRRMAAARLIGCRISMRGLAESKGSDAPLEFCLAAAGEHLLQKGPPSSLRPPGGPTPPGLLDGT